MSRRQLERPKRRAGRRGDDTGCDILHVDMDAFFASVELLERPELAGTPVIVGGLGARSVVSAANYAAREYGVHSAMPMTRARRLCPQATVIPPDHHKYSRVSARVMRILSSITPDVQRLASDEAFLDVAGALRRLGPPATIGDLLRARIFEQEGLTCSVGVAPTMYVAKLASSFAKPDGLLVVPADGVVEFLRPLPVGALWGVGDRTEEQLLRLGLRTVGDVARTPEETLRAHLGPALGTHLARLAWGRDERAVVADAPDKSIGAEETFAEDIADPDVIRRELLRLAGRTATRLRSAGLVGRTVSVKLRDADFRTITRSRALVEHTDVTQQIYAVACELFAAAGWDRARLRLVGVRMEQLAPASSAPHQLTLGESEVGWREAERAVDAAVRKFGSDVVRPGTLVPRADRRPIERE